MTPPMSPQDEREAIARVVNPSAFASWQSLYDYCLRIGDDEPTARHYADGTHKPDCDEALAKADAILALRQPGAEYRRVPIEPTASMRAAGAGQLFGSVSDDWGDDAAAVWSAMLDAALAGESTKGEGRG